MLRKFNKAKIIFSCNAIFGGINNINAGCQNCDSNLTFDIDNFQENDNIIFYDLEKEMKDAIEGKSDLSKQKDSAIKKLKMYNLEKENFENLKKITEESFDLNEKLTKETDQQKQNEIKNEISKKQKEFEELLLNKFIFKLKKCNGNKVYFISNKKSNVNIKGFEKITDKCKEYITLIKKEVDSAYEGGQKLNEEEIEKINDFEKKNKDCYMLEKISFLKKKLKTPLQGQDKEQIVEYSEVVDIFKKK